MGMLSQAQKEKALEVLKTRYNGCPNCHSKGGQLNDVVGLPVMERTLPAGIGPGQLVILALPMTCPACGHMSLFANNGLFTIE
jgi:hypothetical protein